jgi:asparagine synthase (glutamine-hydrolysing)
LIVAQSDLFRSLSIYSQYAVFKKAKGQVKVMLSGQGADELFGGYYHHAARLMARTPQGILQRFQTQGARALSRELGLAFKYKMPQVLKKALLIKNNFTHWTELTRILKDYRPTWDLLLKKFDGDIRAALTQDTTALSLPQLLRYEDRNAMAFGIENRTPFTDYRVIEFAHKLPLSYLYRDGYNKYFLRALAKRRLPAEIANRRDKKGFEAPENFLMTQLGLSERADLFAFRLFLYEALRDNYAA